MSTNHAQAIQTFTRNSGIFNALRGFATAAARVIDPDATLLSLGREFDRAVAACQRITDRFYDGASKTEEEYELIGIASDQRYDECAALARTMVGMPARTHAGVLAKARAMVWCLGDDSIDTAIEEQGTTDLRMALSVVRDLVRMHAH